MVKGVPTRTSQCIPGNGKAAVGRNPCGSAGTQGRATSPGDRFFEGVLAAHRGTADAAGTDWKAATCQFIQDQIQKGVQMTILRLCELGHLTRAALYRLAPDAARRAAQLDLRPATHRTALQL